MSKAKQVDWRNVKPAPVVFVFGNEEFFANRAVRNIREQLKAKHPDLEVSTLEASEYVSGQLYEITAPSLFGEPRLVIINGLERLTDQLLEDALIYLSQVPEDVTTVFRHNNSSVKGKKIVEALRGNGAVTLVTCDKLAKPAEKIGFVQAEFASANRKITQSAANALVEAFNDDIAELAAACEQLLQDSSESITEELVDTYYGGRVETTTFKLADACFAGQEGVALALLRHVLNTGADPVMILGGLAARLRQTAKMFGASSAAAGLDGMPPWLAEKTKRESNYWSEEGMVAAITKIAETDSAVKGGSRDPEFALEALVRVLANRGISA